MTELDRLATNPGNWLDLLCGIRGYITRFDALLGQYAPPGGAPADDAPSEVVELLLGMIAIRDRIVATTDEHAREAAAPAPAEPPGGSLLR
jgi:hypothetical protein